MNDMLIPEEVTKSVLESPIAKSLTGGISGTILGTSTSSPYVSGVISGIIGLILPVLLDKAFKEFLKPATFYLIDKIFTIIEKSRKEKQEIKDDKIEGNIKRANLLDKEIKK